jgi:hypothetical protein
MFKSDVKPSIRRTGAEIINFLVFRKYFDQNGGEKRKMRCLINILYKYEVKSLIFNDKIITLAKC